MIKTVCVLCVNNRLPEYYLFKLAFTVWNMTLLNIFFKAIAGIAVGGRSPGVKVKMAIT